MTADPSPIPWYREVSSTQWKVFLTTFAAWTLDAFDFTILTFVLVDIQNSFSVNKALAGLLGTVTLLFRVVGGIGAGTLADRYGRKGPILFSIAWYTLFAFLSGLSTSYVMLFAFRGLFGIGMGGMWAAGMPLALEQWPARSRGIASGILQAGYSSGFLLSSLVYQLGYPLVNDRPDWGWRLMLWSGVLPAIVVFGLMTRVPESAVWLEQSRRARATGRPMRLSIGRLFDADLRWVTLHTSVLMGAFVSMYQSMTFW
ncbi:MAG: MFS transporter, partial [Vicinamibacterales bacterium]